MYKIKNMWLTPNKWSRPQKENKVEYIIVHWTATPQGSHIGVFNFFEGRKNGLGGFGSAHEMVDNDIVARYIPHNEMAYHVGATNYTGLKYDLMGGTYPNSVAYGIECRVEDMEGNMNELTYNTLLERVVDLIKEHNLSIDRVLLHGDLTGKDCHKLFFDNPKLWTKFKQEVSDKLSGDDDMEILKVKQKFDFLGVEKELEVLNIDGRVYLSAENLRALGLNIKYDDKDKTVIGTI